jgi:hypothetical protein
MADDETGEWLRFHTAFVIVNTKATHTLYAISMPALIAICVDDRVVLRFISLSPPASRRRQPHEKYAVSSN